LSQRDQGINLKHTSNALKVAHMRCPFDAWRRPVATRIDAQMPAQPRKVGHGLILPRQPTSALHKQNQEAAPASQPLAALPGGSLSSRNDFRYSVPFEVIPLQRGGEAATTGIAIGWHDACPRCRYEAIWVVLS